MRDTTDEEWISFPAQQIRIRMRYVLLAWAALAMVCTPAIVLWALYMSGYEEATWPESLQEPFAVCLLGGPLLGIVIIAVSNVGGALNGTVLVDHDTVG